jgi:uncharacterized RDD family membrane protein YckC
MPYRTEPDAPKPADRRRAEREAPRRRREPKVQLLGAAVWRRALSATIDTVVVFGPAIGAYEFLNRILYEGSCTKVTGFYGEKRLIDCSAGAKFGTILISIVVGVVLALLVEVGPTAGGRQSLGRRLVGARAVDRTTSSSIGYPRAAGRFAFRTFISTLLGIGFFWMIWDRDDRTLHDIVCRSGVIDGPRWRPRRRRRRGGFLPT